MTKASSPAVLPKISRAPRGPDRMRRVLVSLLPAEHEDLKRLAVAEGRSASSLARIYLLRGMRAERRHATSDPANPPVTEKES